MSFPKLSWGREKHDLVDRWPKGPDGTPEKPAFLADSTEEDNAAGMTVEMLRAYGIPVMKKYDDKDGTLGKVLFGHAEWRRGAVCTRKYARGREESSRARGGINPE